MILKIAFLVKSGLKEFIQDIPKLLHDREWYSKIFQGQDAGIRWSNFIWQVLNSVCTIGKKLFGLSWVSILVSFGCGPKVKRERVAKIETIE